MGEYMYVDNFSFNQKKGQIVKFFFNFFFLVSTREDKRQSCLGPDSLVQLSTPQHIRRHIRRLRKRAFHLVGTLLKTLDALRTLIFLSISV